MRNRYTKLERIPVSTLVANDRFALRQILEQQIGKSGVPETFARYVDLEKPLFSITSVRRLLTITDRELDKCAKLVGGETVPHTWGMIGDQVVAKVAYIDGPMITDSSVPAEVREQVVDGVSRYNNPFARMRRGHLHDMSAQQFMYGFDASDGAQNEPAIFLVDIEPLFRAREGGCF